MSKSDEQYQSAKSSYDTAVQNYNDTLSKYTGNAGYKNSVSQAKETSNNLSAQQARGAAAQAQSAARSSGMSKAAAAAMGSQQAANAYQNSYANNFNNQQSSAYQAGNAAVGGANTNMQSAQNQIGISQSQDQAKWDRTWGAAGQALNAAGQIVGGVATISDERLKNYKLITEKYISKPDMSVRIKSLKWEPKK